ncbi:MAG: NUDIX hydrolase [Candidatus Heimdallarchaeaceae archaeon]
MRIPKQVLVYPVKEIDDSWEYLLLRRIESIGGFWQGVTGAPEKGEELLDAAKRELLEETSYIPNFIFQTDFSYKIKVEEKYNKNYPEGVNEIPEYVFVAKISQPDLPSIDPKEHDEWKWCSFEEAMELLKWEDNKKALEHIRNILEEK